MKVRTTFECQACGAAAPQWAGRCTGCGEWNTLHEARAVAARPAPAFGAAPFEPALPIAEVDALAARPQPTGVGEVDRVLGGGLVPGSVSLLGGEPGVGKSTLLTQLASTMAAANQRVLYVSAEESRQQVRARAERLGAAVPGVWLAADTCLPNVLVHLDDVRPDVVVIDSIQTMHDPDLGSAPGTVSQVRDCAHRLVAEAKGRGVAVILVGHVTKDGGLAGPRVLEHVVDTVLSFEGERHHGLRMLRAVKHRFGSTDELGIFEMNDDGLVPVPDASALFLADRRAGVPGSAVAATIEGHRPLLVEVQALGVPTNLASPRRNAQGLDSGRLACLVAVLAKRAELQQVNKTDVFAMAVGGVRAIEPGTDLAIALAVESSMTDEALAGDVVAFAEVGLGGELRQVAQMRRRLAEAARLGFRHAIVPMAAPDPPPGLMLHRAATVSEAIARAKGAA